MNIVIALSNAEMGYSPENTGRSRFRMRMFGRQTPMRNESERR